MPPSSSLSQRAHDNFWTGKRAVTHYDLGVMNDFLCCLTQVLKTSSSRNLFFTEKHCVTSQRNFSVGIVAHSVWCRRLALAKALCPQRTINERRAQKVWNVTGSMKLLNFAQRIAKLLGWLKPDYGSNWVSIFSQENFADKPHVSITKILFLQTYVTLANILILEKYFCIYRYHGNKPMSIRKVTNIWHFCQGQKSYWPHYAGFLVISR